MTNNCLKNKVLITTGILLIIGGIAGGYFFVVKGLKPDFLQLKVFTMYSQYLESKKFEWIVNNQADEISLVLYWVGWMILSYNKSNLILSRFSYYSIFNILGYLFFHGLAVVYFLIISLFLSPLFYQNGYINGRQSNNPFHME